MSTGARKEKDEPILMDPVHKQPIGLDVAFAEAGIISGQRMILVYGRKLFAGGKHLNYLIQQVNVVFSFCRKPEILFEFV